MLRIVAGARLTLDI